MKMCKILKKKNINNNLSRRWTIQYCILIISVLKKAHIRKIFSKHLNLKLLVVTVLNSILMIKSSKFK